jgi:hypothetical protein
MAHVSHLIPDRPYLSWGFEVKDLQKYVTTLEKICDNPDFAIDHRNDWLDLLSLKWNLQAMKKNSKSALKSLLLMISWPT